MPNIANVTMLCKVVDNFGDIGVVYRLAKNLRKINPNYKIRIITSDVNTFKKIASQSSEVFDWNNCDNCRKEFIANPPQVILECFQCGRPDWLEEILFEKSVPNIVHIINIDYLTAEPYAEEFHCLKSGTRNPRVKKINFMPGFTAKTGGLILDEPFIANYRNLLEQPKRVEAGVQQLQGINCCAVGSVKKLLTRRSRDWRVEAAGIPKILIFSYLKDFTPIVNAIKKYRKSEIFLGQGVGKESFLNAVHKKKDIEGTKTDRGVTSMPNGQEQFSINELPFLSQENWDKMMLTMDILFIRGEESLSRACLCGKPFVWNAYVQDEDYHLVKVAALLERMKTHFAKEEFAIVENFWLLYNGKGKEEDNYSQKLENACLEFLRHSEELTHGFISFSKSLFALGNFTEKLDEFIGTLQI